MGRKSLLRKRKSITKKVNKWLAELLVQLQYEDLEQLTIDDIARIAGKSKSTIYEYFESKEDILFAACETRIIVLTESILDLNKQNLDTVQLYKNLVEVFAEGAADISIIFLQNIKKYYPKAWLTIDEFTDKFIDLLQAQYQQGIKEGIYNKVSVELLGHLDKLFIIQVVTNPAIFSDEQYSISNLVRDYLNLRLTGLLKR